MDINCFSQESYKNENSYETTENSNELNSMKREIGDNSIKQNKSKKTNRRASETSNDMKLKLSDVSEEDLQKLCEQLSTLNERILTAREITYLRYELPVEMKDKLEMEAQELECLYAEMKDAARNLEIIRTQRAALGKEKIWMEGQINKLKDDAITEMEMIVSVYDSDMLEKWEAVKQSNAITAVENFLFDVKGKLEAMNNLQLLGCHKLAELQNQEKKKGEIVTKKEKKRMNREERGGGTSGRSSRSGSHITNSSQTLIPFLFETDSEDLLDEGTVHNVLYNLVYDQVFNMPAWTQGPLDID